MVRPCTPSNLAALRLCKEACAATTVNEIHLAFHCLLWVSRVWLKADGLVLTAACRNALSDTEVASWHSSSGSHPLPVWRELPYSFVWIYVPTSQHGPGLAKPYSARFRSSCVQAFRHACTYCALCLLSHPKIACPRAASVQKNLPVICFWRHFISVERLWS